MNTEFISTLEKMQAGDTDTIIACYKREGVLYRINAIIQTVVQNKRDAEIIHLLRCMLNDDTPAMGYSVSDFAAAALHVMNAECYCGSSPDVIRLIEWGFRL